MVKEVWTFSFFKKSANNKTLLTGPHSAVGNMSDNRCESDCRSRGREFDPGLVPYFPGDWLWNNFYGHSPPFRWIIPEGLLSVTSENMRTKYWLTSMFKLAQEKSGVRCTDCPAMNIAVDLGIKATKQTNKNINEHVKRFSLFFRCCLFTSTLKWKRMREFWSSSVWRRRNVLLSVSFSWRKIWPNLNQNLMSFLLKFWSLLLVVFWMVKSGYVLGL